MTVGAMASYLQLGGNEITNAARLRTYTDAGIKPKGFDITASGCPGLEVIIPCVDDQPVDPLIGYTLPEQDFAPWYDQAVPESKDFAGLMVTSVTMSAAYSRNITPSVGVGGTLGRLKLNPRTIVVRGWLIGSTCCATDYGLRWLTSALGDQPCTPQDCGGVDLNFLKCCPNIDETTDCYMEDGYLYTRAEAMDQEYSRSQDFFRVMHNVGVTDGVTIISCKGSGCSSCGSCGALLEVEFTMVAGSPYLNNLGYTILDRVSPSCEDEPECGIVWSKEDPCVNLACLSEADCLDDPFCPPPALPPAKGLVLAQGCGCLALDVSRVCSTIPGDSPAPLLREWGTSTINFEVFAGATPLRNLAIRVWANPMDSTDSADFEDCEACTTLVISYVPAGGTLYFSGEERKVVIECNGQRKNGFRNVQAVDDLPFSWPDLTCTGIFTCVDFDCVNTDPAATVTLTRVDRDL